MIFSLKTAFGHKWAQLYSALCFPSLRDYTPVLVMPIFRCLKNVCVCVCVCISHPHSFLGV